MENEAKPIECNLPFERIPTCACDPGSGPPPSQEKRAQCRWNDGPCSDGYYDRHPDATIPVEPKK